MLDGPSVVAELKRCGATHIIWIPDSTLGCWEPAILAEPAITLVRPCREGEAIALAGGLWLGGAHPVVIIQCTGLFEAGDALRNIVHDLGIPLFLIVGVRSYLAARKGPVADNCPQFAEPIMKAWRIPFALLDDRNSAQDLGRAYAQQRAANKTSAVLIAE
jgi:sulfopyruvate decarboxylase TPP-binding subunit